MMDSQILLYLGISQFQMGLMVIIVIVISIAIYFLWRIGVFESVEFNVCGMPQMHILYVQHKGSYYNLMQPFEVVTKDMQQQFRISRNFGMYYDDPLQVPQEECRALLGIVVNEGQVNRINNFLLNHRNYKKSVLPSCKYLVTDFPYYNVVSFMVMMKKVYPKLMECAKKYDYEVGRAVIQVYHFLSQSQKKITIMMPIEKLNNFELWDKQ